MATPTYQTVYDLAEDQMGYVTAAQAAAAGVRQQTLVMMARRGNLQRISRGVYRLVHFPGHPLAQYMQATLWPYDPQGRAEGRVRGVLSHETALALHELSDAAPPKVHITVPAAFRVQRTVPAYLVVHRADLRAHETTALEGMPIVTPERAVRDGIAAHLGPALLGQAIEDGLRSGRITRTLADQLRQELAEASGTPVSGAGVASTRPSAAATDVRGTS